MPQQMNFNALSFGDIAGQRERARKAMYDAISGGVKGIGESAQNIASEYNAEQERLKAEEEAKKKWDNMIAEQEYRKKQDELARKYQAQRDFIADTRYDNEFAQNQKKLFAQEDALKNITSQYANVDVSGMSPEEAELVKSITYAPTYADAIAAQNSLNQLRYQTKMLQMQQSQNDRAARQEEQAKIAENMLNDVAARENASAFDYNVNAKLPPKEVLPAYRDEIQENLDYLLSNPTPSLNKNAKIREYKTLLRAIDERLSYKPARKPWMK